MNVKKTFLAFLSVESLEISLSFPNNLLVDAFNFYSKALYYGYSHFFWLVRQLRGDYPDKYISYNFSLMPYTTTSGWVTSHSNAKRLKQISHTISAMPKTPWLWAWPPSYHSYVLPVFLILLDPVIIEIKWAPNCKWWKVWNCAVHKLRLQLWRVMS